MADSTIKRAQLREVLHSAFAAVRGDEANRSTSVITLDHLLSERVTSIQQSKLPALDELEKKFNSVIQSIKDAGTDVARLEELGLHEANIPEDL
jgi:hypothetical protein